MNTATLTLDELDRFKTPAKKPAIKPAVKPASLKPLRKRHWTDAVFKHSDALGDELRKHGQTL
jgi:hypothetical protein